MKVRINVTLDEEDIRLMDEAGVKNRSEFIRNLVKKKLERFSETQLELVETKLKELQKRHAELKTAVAREKYENAVELVNRAFKGQERSRKQLHPMYQMPQEMLDDLALRPQIQDLSDEQKAQLQQYVNQRWNALDESPDKSNERERGD